MDLIQAVILGLIQGITEWLPISSRGQTVVIAIAFFGIEAGKALNYSIFLHIGTLFAAAYYFRAELWKLMQLKEKQLLRFLMIAVLASAITAIPAYLFLKAIVADPKLLLLLIGLLLMVTGLLQLKKKLVKKAVLGDGNAFFLGLGQGLSVLPGISRSGTTTSVLLFEGFEAGEALRLSFLLSVPSVLIAEILFGLAEPLYFEFNVIVAVLVAAVSGFLSIKLLIKAAERLNFGLFCIMFGLAYLLLAII